jgi:hypothetical protein
MTAGTDANVFINIFGEIGDTGGEKFDINLMICFQ